MQGGRAAYDPPRGREELRAGLDAWCDALEAAVQPLGDKGQRVYSRIDDFAAADAILADVVNNSSALELFRALEA